MVVMAQRVRDPLPAAIWEILGGVDLPVFVASLVQGTFHAIVDASIQRMEAYGELPGAVAKRAGEFARDEMTLLPQTLF